MRFVPDNRRFLPRYDPNGLYFGVELEVEQSKHEDAFKHAQDVVNLLGADKIAIQHDTSLRNGMEITTLPMTYEYFAQQDWAKLLKGAVKLGYRGHQTTTAGYHVHASRAGMGSTPEERKRTAVNVVYIQEQLWDELAKFGRRKQSELNHWARRFLGPADTGYGWAWRDAPEATIGDPESIYRRAVHLTRENKQYSINYQNAKTIEFRIFKSTLNPTTFVANVQLINEIIHLGMRPTEDLRGLTWPMFVGIVHGKYPELDAYINTRGLMPAAIPEVVLPEHPAVAAAPTPTPMVTSGRRTLAETILSLH